MTEAGRGRPQLPRGQPKGRKEVRTMLISTTILFTTIVSAVAIGIGAAYAAIWGILTMFGHRPASQEPALVAVGAATQPLTSSR